MTLKTTGKIKDKIKKNRERKKINNKYTNKIKRKEKNVHIKNKKKLKSVSFHLPLISPVVLFYLLYLFNSPIYRHPKDKEEVRTVVNVRIFISSFWVLEQAIQDHVIDHLQ